MSGLHTFQLDLDFKLIKELSAIDRFGGSWTAIERREGNRSLKQLKSIATVQSVGASTRIEGSKMTNEEVKVLLENIEIGKLEDRDQQEVLGYFNAMDIISESYHDIDVSESSLKNLHNILMKYSEKDQWHKGKYKVNANAVEAIRSDGTRNIIFQTTAPGYETEDAMRDLFDWYNTDKETPSLIKSAAFIYDFLSIHPFQDGNGRLSRLLGSLLLLKHGYSWIQYVSFEHEIESRKIEYYQVLMECQQKRPGENIYPWIIFFLNCLGNIQNKLMQKLDVQKSENQMSPREKVIYSFIESHPGCKSSEIALKLNLPLPTVKRILSEMTTGKFITKHGKGTGTNYTTEPVTQIKNNIAMTLTQQNPRKEFTLKNKYTFIEIKKILLEPKFQWKKPSDWGQKLINSGLRLIINCYDSKGNSLQQPYYLPGFTSPYHYEPVFTLNNPIHIPASFWEGNANDNQFPIKVDFKLETDKDLVEFDVILVYDAALE